MDDVDLAQEINEGHIQRALALRLLPGTGQVKQPSRTECIDCEEPIPDGRRAAVPGCMRCIDCQTMLENWRPL
jgi:phage/conjugal plasmid C-4 type zinc finger TraR family protein